MEVSLVDIPVLCIEKVIQHLDTRSIVQLSRTCRLLFQETQRFFQLSPNVMCRACDVIFCLERDILSFAETERSCLFDDGLCAGFPVEMVRNIRSSRDWSDTLNRRGILESFCLSCGLFVGVELSRRVRPILNDHSYPYSLSQKEHDLDGFDLYFRSSANDVELTLPTRHFVIFRTEIFRALGLQLHFTEEVVFHSSVLLEMKCDQEIPVLHRENVIGCMSLVEKEKRDRLISGSIVHLNPSFLKFSRNRDQNAPIKCKKCLQEISSSEQILSFDHTWKLETRLDTAFENAVFLNIAKNVFEHPPHIEELGQGLMRVSRIDCVRCKVALSMIISHSYSLFKG